MVNSHYGMKGLRTNTTVILFEGVALQSLQLSQLQSERGEIRSPTTARGIVGVLSHLYNRQAPSSQSQGSALSKLAADPLLFTDKVMTE